jgi:NAD(P)-dependent dehydrogenase (short-subunit alcohol dehydrogenase family)
MIAASSGIGRAACLRFAESGMNVWMLDIDGEELLLTQKWIKSKAKSSEQLVLAEVADVSDFTMMQQIASQVFLATGAVHILFNNAGTGLGGGALSELTTLQQVMNVNTYGPINGCLAFVPEMKASGIPGIIINTGSKQGITCPPGNLAYNMSKAALKVYTEGLEHELMLERFEGKGKLRAALLIPGWVNTSILLKAERAKAIASGKKYDASDAFFHQDKPHSGAWMPDQVIEFMIRELDRNHFYILCPDNEVDRETDCLRMTWAMHDITENRQPLSRWHPDYKDIFAEYLAAAKDGGN